MCIYIFIDESEDERRFVVGGIITKDRDKLLDGIYETRRYIKNKKRLSRNQKNKILNEMKEHDLNNSFNDIKRNLLENITYEKTNNKGFVQKDISYFCAYYTKKAEEHFNQERKEEIYKISLVKSLKVIAQDTDEELSLIYDLIYDEFGRNNFEKDLRDLI